MERTATTATVATMTAAVVLSIFGGGCGEGGENESIGVVQDALSGLVTASWGGVMSANNPNTFSDGTSATLHIGVFQAQWACMLSGVWGNLDGATGVWEAIESPGSHEQLLVIGGAPGAALAGSETCVPASDWGGFGLHRSTPPTSPFTQTLESFPNSNGFCGLAAWQPPLPRNFASDSSVTITNGPTPAPIAGGGTWTMTTDDAVPTAVCAKNPVGQNVNGMWDYHIIAPATGTASFTLRDGNGNLLPSGTGCFLTSVQGAFTRNDFNDGVGLSLANGAWTFKASNGKSGWALCVH
jgi:hypothetical protein